METGNSISHAEVVVAERTLEVAKVEVQRAQQNFARAQDLWTMGLISKEVFDQADNALNEAVSKRRKAEAELARARETYRRSRKEEYADKGESPETQRQIIRKLDEELKTLDNRLSRTKIYAPISGTITTYRFQEKVGDYLDEGAEVCDIVNADRVVVEMPVSEKDMDVIEDGLEVKFKVRGYPTHSFHATVDEIAPVAVQSEGASTVLVRSYIDNKDKLLKPGMTGVAKIYCGTSVMAHILTRDLVRFIRTEFWL
jgi:multidrug resistance efflux pump